MGLPSADDLLDANGNGQTVDAEWARVEGEQPAEDDLDADVPVDWPPGDNGQQGNGPGLTLDGLKTEADAASVSVEVWQDWLAQCEIRENDGRSHTDARLEKLEAMLGEWNQGARE